jgi:hypothetical protein
MREVRHCLTLVKGPHRFVFQYVQGREADLLATFVALADDDESPFDWFDAAALSFEMGRQLERELEQAV